MRNQLAIADLLVFFIVLDDLEEGPERLFPKLEGIDIDIGIHINARFERIKGDNGNLVVLIFEIVQGSFCYLGIRGYDSFNLIQWQLLHNLVTVVFQKETEGEFDNAFIQRSVCFI